MKNKKFLPYGRASIRTLSHYGYEMYLGKKFWDSKEKKRFKKKTIWILVRDGGQNRRRDE
jgi:GH25 family lysozyme M1 (1,4-beta-N-acetylmuramidase)